MVKLFFYTGLYLQVLVVFLLTYFLTAGAAYWLLYINKKERLRGRKIQDREAKKQAIYREIKCSLISMLVLALFSLPVVICYQNGYTVLYSTIMPRGWIYFFGSIVICILINDTYFYWLHRFMHLKAVFPLVHKTHHLSKTPTPWAIYSFSPVETFIDFAIFPLLIFFVPLHIVAIGIVIGYNHFMNLGGHFGFEFVPVKWHRHWLFRYGLSVTHHDMHHSKVNCNYGLYFNIWDRLMRTNHRDYEATLQKMEDKIKNQKIHAYANDQRKNSCSEIHQ